MGGSTCYLKHTVSTSNTASGIYQWSYAEFVPSLMSHTSLSPLVVTLHFRVLSLVTMEQTALLLHNSWCKDSAYSAVLNPMLTKTS